MIRCTGCGNVTQFIRRVKTENVYFVDQDPEDGDIDEQFGDSHEIESHEDAEIECPHCHGTVETDYEPDDEEEDNGRLWSDEVLDAYDSIEVDGVAVAYSRHVEIGE